VLTHRTGKLCLDNTFVLIEGHPRDLRHPFFKCDRDAGNISGIDLLGLAVQFIRNQVNLIMNAA
jgi:hypothetical protein